MATAQNHDLRLLAQAFTDALIGGKADDLRLGSDMRAGLIGEVTADANVTRGAGRAIVGLF